MAKQVINIGASPNDGTGDFVRDAFDKTNDNFTELYDGKQDDLISGTNIKTINGDSVLGSGDLVISGGGGASGIHAQLLPGGTIFGGVHQSNRLGAGSNYNTQTFANETQYFPFIPNNTFTTTEMRFYCLTAAANDKTRICIYSHDGLNAPTNLLYESTDIDLSTTGNKTVNVTKTWTKGEVYWIAFLQKTGGASLIGLGSSSADSLQIGNIGGNPFKMWRQTSTAYANGAPATANPNSFLGGVYHVEFK